MLPRNSILFVGRLEPSKKPMLLLHAFAIAAPPGVSLVFIGAGSQRESLTNEARRLGVQDNVSFVGNITRRDTLQDHFAHAIFSVSPGYVGLSLTQSLGFGVPMIVSRSEPHAPEVELAEIPGAVIWFETDSAIDLASKLTLGVANPASHERRIQLAARIRADYSSERMAAGFVAAFNGEADT